MTICCAEHEVIEAPRARVHAHTRPRVRLSVHGKFDKFDPTRTTFLRKQFAQEMNARFRRFRGALRRAIVDQDVFGLQRKQHPFAAFTIRDDGHTPDYRAFDFPTEEAKIAAFSEWMEEQEHIDILEATDKAHIAETSVEIGRKLTRGGWWGHRYVGRAVAAGIAGAGVAEAEGAAGGTVSIETILNHPAHIRATGMSYARAFNDLKGITASMNTQINRVLFEGMSRGYGAKKLANIVVQTVKGGGEDLAIVDSLGHYVSAESRANLLTQTETIRAYHKANIQQMRNNGVKGVEVIAEWFTAGDDRVCAICAGLEGNQYTLDEAENMIPKHPRCRCRVVEIPQSRVRSKRRRIQTPAEVDQRIIDQPSWRYKKARPEFTKDTMKMYTDANGQWTPGRKKLHDAYIRQQLRNKVSQASPEVLATMGGPGGGKTNVLRGLGINTKKYVVVDPDKIKGILPEYKDAIKSRLRYAGSLAHEESSVVSKRLIEQSLKSKYHTLIDTAGNGTLKRMLQKFEGYSKYGAKVNVLATTVPVSVAQTRNRIRFLKTGREVPYTFLRDTHIRVAQGLPQLVESGAINNLTLYDTRKGVSRIMSAKGKVMTIYDKRKWKRFLNMGNRKLSTNLRGYAVDTGLYVDDMIRILNEVIREQPPAIPDTPSALTFRKIMQQEVADIVAAGGIPEPVFEAPE